MTNFFNGFKRVKSGLQTFSICQKLQGGVSSGGKTSKKICCWDNFSARNYLKVQQTSNSHVKSFPKENIPILK